MKTVRFFSSISASAPHRMIATTPQANTRIALISMAHSLNSREGPVQSLEEVLVHINKER